MLPCSSIILFLHKYQEFKSRYSFIYVSARIRMIYVYGMCVYISNTISVGEYTDIIDLIRFISLPFSKHLRTTKSLQTKHTNRQTISYKYMLAKIFGGIWRFRNRSCLIYLFCANFFSRMRRLLRWYEIFTEALITVSEL